MSIKYIYLNNFHLLTPKSPWLLLLRPSQQATLAMTAVKLRAKPFRQQHRATPCVCTYGQQALKGRWQFEERKPMPFQGENCIRSNTWGVAPCCCLKGFALNLMAVIARVACCEGRSKSNFRGFRGKRNENILDKHILIRKIIYETKNPFIHCNHILYIDCNRLRTHNTKCFNKSI